MYVDFAGVNPFGLPPSSSPTPNPFGMTEPARVPMNQMANQATPGFTTTTNGAPMQTPLLPPMAGQPPLMMVAHPQSMPQVMPQPMPQPMMVGAPMMVGQQAPPMMVAAPMMHGQPMMGPPMMGQPMMAPQTNNPFLSG